MAMSQTFSLDAVGRSRSNLAKPPIRSVLQDLHYEAVQKLYLQLDWFVMVQLQIAQLWYR